MRTATAKARLQIFKPSNVVLAMPTLIDLYEDQARGCIELADSLEDPNIREVLRKMARDWMRDAEALRRAASSDSAPPHADDGVRSDDKRAA